MEIGEIFGYALGIVTTNWAPCPSSLATVTATVVGVHQLLDDGQADPASRGVADAGSPPESIEDVFEILPEGCPAPNLSTTILATRSCEETDTLTDPPAGVNLMALVRRLVTT